MSELHGHLFPGDHDEHGAVLGVTVVRTTRGTRLLARRLFLARDGIDYVPGDRGYRLLTPEFVSDRILDCQEEGLGYLAIHCHGGTDNVGFSEVDLASHLRGYQALLDILDGPPVGGLVFAHAAVAGDLWLPGGDRIELAHLDVVESPQRRLTPSPTRRPEGADTNYDRQARLFGDRGQALLHQQKVAVVGAGGAGSLVVEYLARLGVGEIVVIDHDRMNRVNLPRVVGSRRRDVRPWLTNECCPNWLRKLGERLATKKVDVARRVALEANPAIRFHAIAKKVTDPAAARELVGSDYIFLAADTMLARLVVNAAVHQYLVPGVQLGAKAQVDPKSGEVLEVFSVVRSLIPGITCLWCNGLIPSAKLQEEATSDEQRKRQRYVDDDDIPAPSVITLNAVAAAHAVDDYMFQVTGLRQKSDVWWPVYEPRSNDITFDIPRRDVDCHYCSARLATGDLARLPTEMLG